MSNAKLEKPTEPAPASAKGNVVTAKANNETLPNKWALLYFGDIIGKNTLIQYLRGTVLGNEKHIDPKKQLRIFVVETADSKENSNVTKGVEGILSHFGEAAEVVKVPTKFKNMSEAYTTCFNNVDFMGKVLELMGNDTQFLAMTFDNSCYTGLADNFSVPMLDTLINDYNKERPDIPPKRLIFENSHRDLTTETQKHFETIRDLLEEKQDTVANSLLDTAIPIDINAMPEGKLKSRMIDYLGIRDQEVPLTIAGTIDNDPKRKFNIRQYK